jgi:hypothetical protein
MEIEGIYLIYFTYKHIHFMLMIHIHFTGCQYIIILIKRFIFFRAPDCQSTEGYLHALVRSFSDMFYIIV